MATLRAALQQLGCNLELTRSGVEGVASQAERIRDSVAALCDLWQREDTSVGIEGGVSNVDIAGNNTL